VYIFRCAGTSPEIPEIFPKVPDFPETLKKKSGVPGKIFLSGDFQDSPIHPPPSRRHQDPFNLLKHFTLPEGIDANLVKG
jgi:hypothetical protein